MSVLVLALLLAAGGVARADAPAGAASPESVRRIHVRGGAQIHAVAGRDADGVQVRGELVDDAGGPIGRFAVAIQASTPDGPVRLRLAHPCEGSLRNPQVPVGDELDVDTDERGAFCAHVAELPPGSTFTLRCKPSGDRDGAALTVPVESETTQLRTLLRFEPPPEVLDLDRESATVTTSLRIERSEGTRLGTLVPAKREGLALVLEDERGQRLAEATTGGDGRARFVVRSALLDGPGAGLLKAKFAGGAVLAKSETEQAVVRRVDVAMGLSQAPSSSDAEDGVVLEVDVTAARGQVQGGVVEAVRGNESVGAGPVEKGHARVVAAIPANLTAPVAVTLRYVPAAPWWRAGTPITVSIARAPPGVWRQLALAALVAAIGAWVVAGWRRSPKPRAPLGKELTVPPSGRAGVHVIGPADGPGGWRGVIADAHDGTLLAGATLRIVVPSLVDSGVVAQAIADAAGAFTLPATSTLGGPGIAHRSDARLIVEAEAHSTYEVPLPPPSVLSVALVTRRRALLERLVRWARRHGAPFDSPPEPTPGHVRRVAARADARDIESWAREVEQAAYGAETVGQAAEQRVRAAEPRGIG